jgi:hypothetical protein
VGGIQVAAKLLQRFEATPASCQQRPLTIPH